MFARTTHVGCRMVGGTQERHGAQKETGCVHRDYLTGAHSRRRPLRDDRSGRNRTALSTDRPFLGAAYGSGVGDPCGDRDRFTKCHGHDGRPADSFVTTEGARPGRARQGLKTLLRRISGGLPF